MCAQLRPQRAGHSRQAGQRAGAPTGWPPGRHASARQPACDVTKCTCAGPPADLGRQSCTPWLWGAHLHAEVLWRLELALDLLPLAHGRGVSSHDAAPQQLVQHDAAGGKKGGAGVTADGGSRASRMPGAESSTLWQRRAAATARQTHTACCAAPSLGRLPSSVRVSRALGSNSSGNRRCPLAVKPPHRRDPWRRPCNLLMRSNSSSASSCSGSDACKQREGALVGAGAGRAARGAALRDAQGTPPAAAPRLSAPHAVPCGPRVGLLAFLPCSAVHLHLRAQCTLAASPSP